MQNEQNTIALPPAVYATAPAQHVSSRYKFVPTLEYIQAFEARGWKVTASNEQKKRKGSVEHGKHMVTMLHEDFDTIPSQRLGGLVPRIHLLNSHDWSSRFQVIMGIFRLICSNGAMVAHGAVSSASFTHHSATAKEVSDVLTDAFFDNVKESLRDAEVWSLIDLSDDELIEFATIARNLRFGEDSPVRPEALLEARREEDNGNNLWLTFNRLQENTTKGGLRFAGMQRAARPLVAIDASVKVNTGLWSAAQNIALRRG